MNIDIILDSDASDSEVEAVKAVLREEGINGSVKGTLESRSLGEDPWVIILYIQVAYFLKGFTKGFATTLGEEAARDVYQGLRRVVSRLSRIRGKSNGCVELCDDNTRTHVILTPDLPEEAYKQLAQKSVEQLKGGYWTWDSNLKEWRRI